MDRAPTTQTLTVIVVGDERSPMRRFHIARETARRAVAAAAVGALLLALALVDWGRLRLQSVDVARLSDETRAQREAVESVASSLEELEAELERLREFERKVRVIANLPESRAVPVGGETAAAGPRGAQGGGVETGEGGPPLAVPAPPHAPLLPADEIPGQARLPENHVHPAALARVARKAGRLAPYAMERRASFEELLAQLEGKTRRLDSTPSIWPTQGWLTSRYGYRISPFTGRRQFHGGIDVAADLGTGIVAPARGKVVAAGKDRALGMRVVIDHGWGVRTSYGHVHEAYVRVGEEVERGQRIAAVGSSGRSTGPHLHYAVEVNGRSHDPLDYILE
jgi:septal ring factor EnvC (AmiA/AmiB activator)